MNSEQFHSSMQNALDFIGDLGIFLGQVWSTFPSVLQTVFIGIFVVLIGYSVILFIFKLLV